MKSALILSIAFLFPFFAHADTKFIECRLVNVDATVPKPLGFINFDNVTAALNDCDGAGGGGIVLSGVNNSACLAADNLRDFLSDAPKGEKVRVLVGFFSNSSEGGFENKFEVINATRPGKKMVTKTLIEKGRRVQCSTTQVQVFRN